MAGYPNLFPSGFLEFDDTCSGPILYRNQPSREQSYEPTLNDFMNKYVTGDIKQNDFIQMLTYLKFFSRQWDKLPNAIRGELLKILSSSDSKMGDVVLQHSQQMPKRKEHFGEDDSIDDSAPPRIKNDNRMNIFIIVVIAIAAIILGYLIACC